MNALTGDQICIHSSTIDRPDRTGTIVEVRGEGGQPPYLVRFDDGHERLLFPGSDCVITPQHQ